MSYLPVFTFCQPRAICFWMRSSGAGTANNRRTASGSGLTAASFAISGLTSGLAASRAGVAHRLDVPGGHVRPRA